MSPHKLKVTLPLLLGCAMSLSSCAMRDSVAPEAAAPGELSVGPVETRGGVDGLRADLAWARSIARSAPGERRITIGGAGARDVSIDELVARLQGELGVAEGRTTPHSTAAAARAALSPGSSPAFDYLSFGDVGGATSIYSSGGPPGVRTVTVYAYTSCYLQPSMTVADLKSLVNVNDFATGARLLVDWPFYAPSSPSYTSASLPMRWGPGPAISVWARSTHTCEKGPRGDWPFVPSSAYTVT
jgi:hypothetical protein